MTKIEKKLLSIIPKELPYDSDCVTFFEGSNALHSDGAANNLRNFLIENKIRHNVIHSLSELSDKYILQCVESTLDGVLAFETTGSSKEFGKISEMVIRLSNKGYRFTLIECVINTPTIYRIPKEAHKSLKMYSLDCFDDDIDKWTIDRLKRG